MSRTFAAKTGDRDVRFVLERHSTTSDSFGGVSKAWTGIIEFWGTLQTTGMQQTRRGNKTVDERRSRVRTPRHKGVLPTTKDRLRIKDSERILNIEGMANVNDANREWEFMCSEVVT